MEPLFIYISIPIIALVAVILLSVGAQKKQRHIQEQARQIEQHRLQAQEEKQKEVQGIRAELTAQMEQRIERETEKTALYWQQKMLQEEERFGIQMREFQQETLAIRAEQSRHQDQLLEKEQAVIFRQESLTKQERELATQKESIAQLTTQDARKQVMAAAQEEAGYDMLQYQKKALEEARDMVQYDARHLVTLAIQRCASEVANEATITTIKLQNNDEKGKIIGKGGRNILWLEKTLGVELIIDETPDVVTISGFSSIRRHIAKRTLEMLLADGRLHPSAIEETYEKAAAMLSDEIAEAGHEAVSDLGIMDFPEKLIRIIGRLKFRTSYGQNMLKHSIEMARLAGILADEINEKFPHRNPISKEMVIKGALLHDIGKAIDEETQPKGDHIALGAKVCDTFGLDWRIRKAVTAHHDESYEDAEHGFCLEAVIVDACDNISGGRPGARKESLEAYYQRVEAMEKIAEETPGVNKAWIMKGSRELWIFFDTHTISPAQMHTATKEVAHRIQLSVRYPGEVKVIGMWEDRAVEYAV
jgi:ribonucrease Y